MACTPEQLERARRYRNSEKGKKFKKAYQSSEKYLKWRREYQKRVGYGRCQRYQRTPKGFWMRLYRNMQSRVTGVQKLKAHLYFGKELLPREDFYEWANNSKHFWVLWEAWIESGYDRKLTPSVNRIDSTRGYTLDNMEWLTNSQNSALVNRHRKI